MCTQQALAASPRRASGSRGFTLIEMVVVVALVGILAAAAQPILALVQRRSDETLLRQNLRTLRSAIDAYKLAASEQRIAVTAGASGYPPSLGVLVDGVAQLPVAAASGSASEVPAFGPVVVRKIYFLRRMPRDPFSDRSLPAAETWGLRSYESSSEAPAAGRDVFDVYSPSEGTGLDGSAYRTW